MQAGLGASMPPPVEGPLCATRPSMAIVLHIKMSIYNKDPNVARPRPCHGRAAVQTFAATGPTRMDVASSKLQAAAKALDDRLRASVLAEADGQQNQIEKAYSKASEKTLIREGVVLAGLVGHLDGRLFGDMLWSFSKGGSLQSAGADLPSHKFKTGSGVTVSISKSGGQQVATVEATVFDVKKTLLQLAVAPQAAARLAECQGSDVSFKLILGAQDVTSKRQLAALDRLGDLRLLESAGEKVVRAILLGSPKSIELAEREPEWVQKRSWKVDIGVAIKKMRGVNDSQRAAIALALMRTLTLWQGPPGTGKTRTILEFLSLMCRLVGSSAEREDQIGVMLAVADTNAAADNLLEGLLAKGIAVVRVGSATKVRPELRSSCIDAVAERTALGRRAALLRDQAAAMMIRAEMGLISGQINQREAKELQREISKTWAQAEMQMKEAANEVLNRCQVVVGTCAAAGEIRLNERQFRVVVIDEATQATEPSTLIALVKGAECVVMAGDHRQLPPTVISDRALKLGMGLPLFSRLQNAGIPALLLNQQYRMHPAIASFPSARFYDGKVRSGVDAGQRPLPQGFNWENSSFPVAFLGCTGQEVRARVGLLSGVGIEMGYDGSGSSYGNKAQADMAMDIVSDILNDASVNSCVILAPYNGQVRLLMALCKSRFSAELELGKLIVSSVDGFQGREADVVVLSTVRCNYEGHIGFVSDARRMNVALTRARRGLIVIGCKQTLAKGSPVWRDWLAWVDDQTAKAPIILPGNKAYP